MPVWGHLQESNINYPLPIEWRRFIMAQGTNDRLNPLADIVFSCMFQNMDGAPAMKELINAVLINAGDEPIAEIVDMRSQYPQLAEQPMGKSGRLDVKARTADGDLVNTEVQLWPQEFFIDRELFYGDKMMVEDVKSGDAYQDMPKTRVIAFMGFILREDNPDIVQPVKFMYTKEPVRVASDKIRIYNVELPKFTEEYDSIEDVSGESEKGNALLQWLYMLTRGYQSEEEMEMLETRTVGMDNFSNLYHRANADQKLRDRYEYQMSVRLEENSRLRAAEDKGRIAGEEKAKMEMAKKMYQRGDSPADIADIVGYALEKVEQWLGLVTY